jgi:hypothetical protein
MGKRPLPIPGQNEPSPEPVPGGDDPNPLKPERDPNQPAPVDPESVSISL